MTTSPRVLHLVDDATPGGVTRVLEHIQTCPLMAQTAHHIVRVVPRGRALPNCQADLIVSHLSLSWRRLPGLIAFRARHAGKPLVHVEHSYTLAFTAQNVPSKLRFFTMLRISLALFDTVVAVSRAQAAWLRQRRLVRSHMLQVIEPVVDLQSFRKVAAKPKPTGIIGAIGRLHAQKGFDLLIRAFRELPAPDAALHIYGSGPEEAALRDLAGNDGRIRFMGHSAAPAAAMQSVDVVAIPSRWEAFGLVALEARAAGRPILCSKVDGLTSSAGRDATFVQTHSKTAWTRALADALGQDPAPLQDRADTCEQQFAQSWGRLVRHHTKGHDPAQIAQSGATLPGLVN